MKKGTGPNKYCPAEINYLSDLFLVSRRSKVWKTYDSRSYIKFSWKLCFCTYFLLPDHRPIICAYIMYNINRWNWIARSTKSKAFQNACIHIYDTVDTDIMLYSPTRFQIQYNTRWSLSNPTDNVSQWENTLLCYKICNNVT